MKYLYKRNYGIDVLRIVAMYMIVVLHVLKHGGILNNVVGEKFAMAWLLDAIALCAVNCYALISGYVGYNEKEESIFYYKYIVLWFQVCLYSILLTVVVQFVTNSFSLKDTIKAMLPVTTSQYWYFTSYTGVFFIAPWINKLFRSTSEKEVKQHLLVIVSSFLMYVSIVGILYDPFSIKGGYSFVWLTIMYILGVLLKRLQIVEKTKVQLINVNSEMKKF